MKLLSDFDGVWTNPLGEAAAVRAELLARSAALLEVSEERARALIKAAVDGMLADPVRYGWTVNGQVSAFCDEDPFVANNAIAHFIEDLPAAPERVPDPELRAALLGWRRRVRESADYADMTAFANAVFMAGTKAHRDDALPRPTDEDCRAIQAFLDAGHQVVIVSNSSTGKIVDFLGRSPLRCVVGGPEEEEAGAVRVRGGAMKFVLADQADDRIRLAGREPRCDRPSYRAILAEEAPDAIVGDVVSLDFALPWKLRAEGRLAARFFLVERSYTPLWSRAVFRGADAGPGDRIISELHELPPAMDSTLQL